MIVIKVFKSEFDNYFLCPKSDKLVFQVCEPNVKRENSTNKIWNKVEDYMEMNYIQYKVIVWKLS